MKKNIFLHVAAMAVCAVLLLSGCNKDSNNSGNTTNVGNTGNTGGTATGKKLTGISYLYYEKYFENYTLRNTDGDYGAVRINWNGNNIAGIRYAEYEDGNLVESASNTQYIYSGNNLTEIRTNNGSYQEITQITYNNAQITEVYNTWDEGGGYSGWNRIRFTYNNNNKILSATRTTSSGSSSSWQLTWSGDNVATVQRYDDGSLYRTTNYTYDSKKSAYSSIPAAVFLMDAEFEMLSANNVIMESKEYYSSGSVSTDSYTYTYDGDLPVKRVTHNTPNYSSSYYEEEETVYFQYSNGTGASQIPTVYYINVTSGNTDLGSVNGRGAYAAGSVAVIYANAFSTSFQSWNDGSTANPRSITVNGNASYVANFSQGGSTGGTLLSEDFDSGIPYTWTTIDSDGDGKNWMSTESVLGAGYGHNGSTSCAMSQSYENNTGVLYPDNYLVTPSITIPNTNGYTLDWYVAAQDASYPSEYYSVYVGYLSGGTFTPYATLYTETVTAMSKEQGTWRWRSVNLNSYKGQTVRFAFRHYNCSDNYFLLIDDVEISNSKSGAKMSAGGSVGKSTEASPRRHSLFHYRNGAL